MIITVFHIVIVIYINIFIHLLCAVEFDFIFTFLAFIPSLDTERVLSGKELFHCIFFSNEIAVKYHR